MIRVLCSVAFLIIAYADSTCAQEESYPVHPDSQQQAGVPAGEVLGPFLWKSKIFPGTTREYGVYVPSQYDEAKPACVLVVQDGMKKAQQWKLPTVMDNLIHQGDMPVSIGIFVSPGVVSVKAEDAQPRFNRSFEYDGLGDRYARFLLQEILPEVEKKYKLSHDPNDRAIAGSSSGAIAAFTVAWERPDEFRRVFSAVGTYVGLRGGDAYPVLIRKFEPKPIRIFLQDGSNDLDIYAGSWFNANLSMLSALKYSGYDVKHRWGEGGHNGKHATAILPDALRWLWRDYPEPIQAGIHSPLKRRTNVLIPGEDWELVSEGHKYTEGPAVNADGEVFFSDVPNSRIHKIAADGTVSVFADETGGANGLMFDADGWLYACCGKANEIRRYDENGNSEVILTDAPCNDCIVLTNGGYYSDPKNQKVWHVDGEGERTLVDEGIGFPNGVVTSTDQTLLLVNDRAGKFVYSFQIQPDGSLKHKQQYGWLHLPDDQVDSGADGMTVDTEGRTYVATRLGVQVLDQLGRVHFVIRKPQAKKVSNVVFGGPDLDILYVTCTDKVYRRKLNAVGVVPSRGPVKPPKPRL